MKGPIQLVLKKIIDNSNYKRRNCFYREEHVSFFHPILGSNFYIELGMHNSSTNPALRDVNFNVPYIENMFSDDVWLDKCGILTKELGLKEAYISIRFYPPDPEVWMTLSSHPKPSEQHFGYKDGYLKESVLEKEVTKRDEFNPNIKSKKVIEVSMFNNIEYMISAALKASKMKKPEETISGNLHLSKEDGIEEGDIVKLLFATSEFNLKAKASNGAILNLYATSLDKIFSANK